LLEVLPAARSLTLPEETKVYLLKLWWLCIY
jgi:hypothetical protein